MTAQRDTVSPPPGAADSLPQPFPNIPHPPYIVRDAVPLNPLHESPPDIYPNFIPFIDDLKIPPRVPASSPACDIGQWRPG